MHGLYMYVCVYTCMSNLLNISLLIMTVRVFCYEVCKYTCTNVYTYIMYTLEPCAP